MKITRKAHQVLECKEEIFTRAKLSGETVGLRAYNLTLLPLKMRE
jgi:hypothetical protein